MTSFTVFERLSRTFRDHQSHLKLVLLCTAVSGGGVLAYGEVAASEPAVTEKKRVVVLGTGWAGTSFLKNLNNPKYEVQVVSPRNYFAFTPLLPSVTCGTVEARSIVEPVRNIFRKTLIAKQHFDYLTPKKKILAFPILFETPNAPLRKYNKSRLNGRKLADIAGTLFASMDEE